MEHVVFFPAPDGTPAFRRFADIDDAARFVEHLRNIENVSSASVYSLTEVPLAFKAWYRVELPTGSEHELSIEAPLPVQQVASVEADPAQPATVAEIAASYSRPDEAAVPVEQPGVGSLTGIVVPDEPLMAVGQFAVPTVPVTAPTVPTAPTSRVEVEPPAEAQVLEPTFGARRERGLGFFAR